MKEPYDKREDHLIKARKCNNPNVKFITTEAMLSIIIPKATPHTHPKIPNANASLFLFPKSHKWINTNINKSQSIP
jgi:hypothetical protein